MVKRYASRSKLGQTGFRNAAFLLLAVWAASCASMSNGERTYAAHGYLTPGPTSEPEIIGIFDDIDDCREAADAWASQQVVGNPVHAECYPVDRH